MDRYFVVYSALNTCGIYSPDYQDNPEDIYECSLLRNTDTHLNLWELGNVFAIDYIPYCNKYGTVNL